MIPNGGRGFGKRGFVVDVDVDVDVDVGVGVVFVDVDVDVGVVLVDVDDAIDALTGADPDGDAATAPTPKSGLVWKTLPWLTSARLTFGPVDGVDLWRRNRPICD